MTTYLSSLALALSLLLLGGALPGGTYVVTPATSLWLLLLTYLGPRGPRALLQLVAGEPAPVWQLAQTRFGVGARTLLLLGLPVWLLQCYAGLDGLTPPKHYSLVEPINLKASTFRSGYSPAQVWFEPDQPTAPHGPGSVHIQTRATNLTLRGQAHDGPLGAVSPAASVAWAWADLDLLPDLVVRVAPETDHSSEFRTFYLPLTDTAVREQTALADHLWTAFLLGYPVLGLSALAFLAGRVLYRLARLIGGVPMTSR